MVRFRVGYPQVLSLAGLGLEMISHMLFLSLGPETYRFWIWFFTLGYPWMTVWSKTHGL